MRGRCLEKRPGLRVNSAGRGAVSRLPRQLACGAFAAVLGLSGGPGVSADTGDFDADQVLGQSSFERADSPALGPANFALPTGVAIDRSVTPNRIYVTDLRHDRVLGWSDVGGCRGTRGMVDNTNIDADPQRSGTSEVRPGRPSHSQLASRTG